MKMNRKKFGYIRVSSKEQNEGRQIQSMKAQGIEERDIFMDKQSEKTSTVRNTKYRDRIGTFISDLVLQLRI
jgi:DNA invertase Pin-like site-specific DNA recombinase